MKLSSLLVMLLLLTGAVFFVACEGEAQQGRRVQQGRTERKAIKATQEKTVRPARREQMVELVTKGLGMVILGAMLAMGYRG